MTTGLSTRPRHGLPALGQAQLATVVHSGLLGCGVPQALGGAGGSLADLAAGAQALARQNAAAAWVLWAQRLAIEALLQSPNIALREHLLPDLLCGARAGTLPKHTPPALPATALVAIDGDQGMRLFGHLPCVPNLQWQGFSLVAPVHLGGAAPQWVMLRSEEAGLRVGMDLGAPCPHGSRSAELALDGVFFRADEHLGDASLPGRMQPVAQALATCLCSTPG